MFDRLLTTRWSIILAGTLIATAPLLGLALFVYITVTHELERLSSERQQALASTSARLLDEKLQGKISFGNAYAARSHLARGIISGDVKVTRRILQNLVETSVSIDRAYITSPKGILLADFPAAPNVMNMDMSQRDWYLGVSRKWTPYISEFYLRDSPPHISVFAIAVPVRSASGAVIGILVMLPNADFVKNTLDGMSQTRGNTYVVDNEGTTIYHPRLSANKSINMSGSTVVKKVVKGLNGYEKGRDQLTGETMISGYHPVDISGWGVVTESPIDSVLAPVKKVTGGIYLFTFLMLLVSAWLAYQRSELIFSRKKASDELIQEDTVNKAYGDMLTLINRDWYSVEELAQAALIQINNHVSIMAGVTYLVNDDNLIPLSAMGVPLPFEARGIVPEAVKLNETITLRDIPADSLLCISTGFAYIVPAEISAIPLTAKNKVVAVLELASLHGFGETDLRIINRIVPQLGIGINTIRSNMKLKRLTGELQESNDEFQSINEELIEQQQELAESNKRLEEVSLSKSDFLANMSHELRTPLNAVIGFSEVLQDQMFGPINDKQQEYVNNILTSGKHLLSLINDILDLSKVESGKMNLEISNFSLRETVDASMIMLREKAMKGGIELIMELTSQVDVRIEADQRKLKQILFNLLSNAVKFTPKDGTVVVSAVKDGDFIEITVADTGVGVKEEDIPKLFHAFTQLESVYTKEFEGTGLGLALTRQLVELHGGKIWVNSMYGIGSRFSFTIPLILGALGSATQAARSTK